MADGTRSLTIGRVALGARPAIIAAGGEADLDALVAADDADLVELRADLFDAPTATGVVTALRRLRTAPRPIVLTVRSGDEGGRAMPATLRADIYRAGIEHADAVDVEIASVDLVAELVPLARAARKVVVLSAHDFDGTPARDALQALVDRAYVLGADVAKIATVTHALADVHTLLEVTLASRARGVVTLGMGPLGPLTRVVLPAAGSLLTFAAADRPTAPGQLPLAELAALVRRLFPA
jgi:3-dehydroquinate dehydratase I